MQLISLEFCEIFTSRIVPNGRLRDFFDDYTLKAPLNLTDGHKVKRHQQSSPRSVYQFPTNLSHLRVNHIHNTGRRGFFASNHLCHRGLIYP